MKNKYELIFKIKVKLHKLLAYSFVFFSLDSDTKECTFKYVLCSLKPNVLDDISINFKWEILKEKIFDISVNQSENLNQSITEDIKTALKEVLEEEGFKNKVFEYAENNKYDELKEELLKIFEDLSDRIDIQCETEKKILESAEETKKEPEPELEDESEDKRNFIDIIAVEDKILGKRIDKLVPGDKIVLKVTDQEFITKNVGETYVAGEYASMFVEYYTDSSENKFAIFKVSSGNFGRILIDDNEFKIRAVVNNEDSGMNMSIITDNSMLFYLILFSSSIILIFLTWLYYERIY